ITAKAPVAVRYAKEAIQKGYDVDMDSGIALEANLFGLCFATEDQKEGMRAFLDKRPAAFNGR
ncbi:MAG: enoyl-CoA hydratase/isomerase family protein, partial [Bacteroidales bacterium]|nr:enoyl-CoA hydratase/isomerase family protein [Bacteroidales bacterium]